MHGYRNNEVESKITTKRIQNEDGSSVETTIEEVTGGYIKTVCTRTKNSEGNWDYKTDKSVSMENPDEEKSLAEKLEHILKG